MDKSQTPLQQVLYVLTFAIVGCVIGTVTGYQIEPNFGKLIAWPAIIGGLAGLVLAWFYKSRRFTVNLVILLCLGEIIGLFLGTVFGGMVGTLASFPFPSTWTHPIFMTGTFLGMFMGSIATPILLVTWHTQKAK